MSLFQFGVGTAIARRNGVDQNNVAIVNPTPSRLLTLQDIDVEFDRDLKQLFGGQQFAVDIAAGTMKISGKAKYAGLEANTANDLFFGQTLTSTASTGFQMAVDESHTAAATVTIAPPGTGTFVEDRGVRYHVTGVELVRVASAPTVGQYAVNESTGVYTFNASEAGTLDLSYRYTVGSGVTLKVITLNNQLMGISPAFEFEAQTNYPNSASGVVNTLNLKLNSCRASKFGFPLKNQDFMLLGLDFMACADASGSLGTLSMVQ